MNILQLYDDFNIPYDTEGQKNSQTGWINITCPFCDDSSNHLGYNISGDYFNCWRCGSHPIKKTLAKLLNLSQQEAQKIIKQYGGKTYTKEPVVKIRAKAHKFPSGVGMMKSHHKRYLANRGFDPDRLEDEWNLFGTGPVALLDGIDYKHRIMVPIYWNGEQVSFQARDITNRHKLKYIACPKDRELILHQSILYGKQDRWGTTGICVEGVTDVWRFGDQSFATFGIKIMPKQLRLIATIFKRVAVVFDDDKWAEWNSCTLVNELKFRGVDAFRVPIEGDPGSMKQDDADHLIKQLLS